MIRLKFIVIILCAFVLTSCTSKKDKALEMLKSGIEKMNKNDNDGAVADFTKAIEYNPELDQAYYHRANTKYNMRDYKGAMADYNEAIRVNPGFADAYANRGSLKSGNGDRDGACADWRKAKELGKDDMEAKIQNCP
jgi:tetratricopeptide (TPR) repeat protein